MDKFTAFTAPCAPIIRSNVDTDAIIPSREMKQVSKKGLSVGLFAGWRYLSEGSRELNPDFILNQPEYEGTQILLSGANFGCGSSREHAVWALKEYGIKAIIAPSFSNIFYNNCIRNGILPIRLQEGVIEKLNATPPNNQLTINLENQLIIGHDSKSIAFSIEPANRDILLHGKDPISETLKLSAEINHFIDGDKKKRPWAHL